jgi:hypothetical protein
MASSATFEKGDDEVVAAPVKQDEQDPRAARKRPDALQLEKTNTPKPNGEGIAARSGDNRAAASDAAAKAKPPVKEIR